MIRDILHRLRDRFPRHVLIWPVLVQGEGAAEQIAAAIAGFNAIRPGGPVPRPDLLIVARGGGSLEDLWAFNEEIVVRAAAASTIPLISAVGHETDTTLIDFAADLSARRHRRRPPKWRCRCAPICWPICSRMGQGFGRALQRLSQESRLRLEALSRGLPRPGQIIAEKLQTLDGWLDRLVNARIGYFERRWQALALALPTPRQQIAARRGELTQTDERLRSAIARALKDKSQRLALARLDRGRLMETMARLRERLTGLGQLLDSLSYQKILARGFALVRNSRGRPVLAAASVAPGAGLSIQFADGVVSATADAGGGMKKSDGKTSKPRRSEAPAAGKPDLPKKQGSLF